MFFGFQMKPIEVALTYWNPTKPQGKPKEMGGFMVWLGGEMITQITSTIPGSWQYEKH